MDPITIGLLAGGGMGLLKGNSNIKKEMENDKYRKVAVAMSPWTGMGDPGRLNLGGPLESGLQGAAMGGQMGGMLGGAGGAAAAAPSAAPQAMGAGGANVFGGQDMAAQMGQDYGQMGSPGAMGNFKYNLMAQR